MRQYYERYWEKPEEFHDPTAEKRVYLFIKRLLEEGIFPYCKILDIGCGNGDITHEIHSHGFDTIGMDISEKAIEYARKNHPHLTFVCCSAEEKYPFEDSEFKAIFAGDLIEHVGDVGSMLFEVNRVLKKGGIFIITTPYHGLWKSLSIVLFNFNTHFDPEGAHLRFFTRKSLEKCLNKYGFKVVNTKYIGRRYPFSKGMLVTAKKVRNLNEKDKNVGFAIDFLSRSAPLRLFF